MNDRERALRLLKWFASNTGASIETGVLHGASGFAAVRAETVKRLEPWLAHALFGSSETGLTQCYATPCICGLDDELKELRGE